MKKLIILSVLTLATIAAIATGTFNFYPPNIVGSNPSQSGSIVTTNAIPATFTNTVAFPFPFYTAPVMTFVVQATNAANNPLTTSITSTNFTVTSGNTNATILWTAYIGYPRVQTGIDAAGSIIGGSTTVTNVFNPPFATTPTVNIEGSGALYATNAGVWASSVTTSNMVISTGNTNQIIYWGAFGQTLNPGYNVISY